MFRFENPFALYFLFIIPLMIGLWYYANHKVKIRKKAFGTSTLVNRLITGQYAGTQSIILWLVSMCLLIIAMANPQYGLKKEKVKVENIDIFIALDISSSMNATDISPSRLEKSKRFIEQFIQSRRGDQIGLIFFAGAAYLQMPLTNDYAAASLFARSANTEMASTQGTAISEAIDMAIRSVKEKNQRALVIISDGEDHDDDAKNKASDAADKGWNIFTIGAGTESGSLVPTIVDGREEFKTDEEGNPVKSILNKKLLEEIAESGNGASYLLESENDDIISEINVYLNKIQKKAVEIKSFTEYRSFYQYFLAISFLVLLFWYWKTSGLKFNFKKKGAFITFVLLCFYMKSFSQSAHKNLRNGDMLYGFGKYTEAETAYRKAASQKPSLKSTYNLGNTLMNQERYDEAIKTYEAAAGKAKTVEEKASVFHNLGNALYKKQQFKESIDAYKKALRYQPDDTETKENLALARRELKKQQNQQQQDKQNQDKNKDQQNQQQNKDNKQQNKDNNQDNDQQNQQQDQQNKQNSDSQQQQSQNNADKKMSRQDAQKLLEIMDNEEKKVQQKMKRPDGKPARAKKDW